MVIEKTCSKCGFVGTAFGRGLLCNECLATRRREWRKRDPSKDAAAEARRGEKRKQARPNYAQRVANANGERICAGCRQQLPFTEFYKQGRDGWCKSCRLARSRAYNAENADAQNKLSRARYRALKEEALAGYGNQCACCSESCIDFLTLDHVEQDGAAHRREIGKTSIYRWAIKNNWPAGLQVLCANCNCASYRNDGCPHRDPIKDLDEWAARPTAATNRYWRRLKLQMARAYGGECECCGIDDIRFLSMEHKGKNGAAHRREIGAGSAGWKWARDNNYPDTLGVLCFSCNMASYWSKQCPHVLNTQRAKELGENVTKELT